MNESIHVLIADDHSLVRVGLREILSEHFPQMSFGEAASKGELEQQLGTRAWDLLLLDLGLPDGSGLDALQECREKYPKMMVLVLSMYPEEKFAIRVLRGGAMGYMTKQMVPEEIVQALSLILSGKRYLSPAVTQEIDERGGSLEDGDDDGALSQREMQVITGIANGKAMKEIAGELDVSMKSASTYRTRAMRKLNLHNNADLVLYALDHGLIVPK